MAEVHISSPVAVRWVETEDEFFDDDMMAREPGLMMFDDSLAELVEGAPRRVWYSCPCGCGAAGALLVGQNEKPASSPSWAWTGGFDKTTLHPSVHHVGHWHGWVRGGYWVQA